MTDDRPEQRVTDGSGNSPRVVDARGMPCPLPVIELAKAVRDAEIDSVVVLQADDPAAAVDIPVWCRMQRQQLISQREADAHLEFEVRKVRELG